MKTPSPEYQRLRNRIDKVDRFAIAVSGGVDSVTLAIFSSHIGANFEVYHAISPAVPSSATDRVREFARKYQWALKEIVAGEFHDENYVANPYNRCFYCKMNLYSRIRLQTTDAIFSGTNIDDLSDYRPGLEAAANAGVSHPYVDASIPKSGVRKLASELGARSLSVLPASPCLSSRVETGIAIEANVLNAIDQVEFWLLTAHRIQGARCRVRKDRVAIELEETSLSLLTDDLRLEIRAKVMNVFASVRTGLPVVFERYKRGSAFVHGGAAI